MLRQFIAICGLAVSTTAMAAPALLDSAELKMRVAGSIIELDTPLGTKIPIRFSRKGRMSGKAGSLASVLGAAKDRGRWWVADNRLCYKWFRWFEAEVHCLKIRQDGTRIYWRQDDGKSGTATLVSQAPAPSPPKIKAPAPVIPVAKIPAPRPATPAPKPKPVVVAHVGPSMLFELGKITPRAMSSQLGGPAETVPPPKDGSQADGVGVGSELGRSSKKRKVTRETVRAHADEAPTRVSSVALQASFSVAGVEENDVLNVRRGPSADHDAVGGIPAETSGVKIVGACRDDWCPVRHRKLKGWVHRFYLAEETGGSRPVSTASR
jgi:Bacterial SH3 domain